MLTPMDSPYFSATYIEAREKFCTAAQEAGFKAQAHIHPTAQSPEGLPLAMDVAWIGPRDAKGVLLNLSGTHGAEGFAGSAAQIAWLKVRGFEHLPRGLAVLMVHAVNPFGFSHFSRTTEDNVDLNRNWIDFEKPAPINRRYKDYHKILTPPIINSEVEDQILRELATMADKRGQWDIENAMSRGQYEVPDGLGFGGQSESWSRRTLSEIIKVHLVQAERVAFIDWHTGTPGIGEIIYLCYSEPGTPSYENAARLWDEENIRPEKVDDQWGNKRPGREGVMFWGIQNLVANLGGIAAGGVIEIGTREQGDIRGAARASLYDRYLRFETDRFSPKNKELLETVLACYYRPDDEAWKDAVIEKSANIYARTLKGLKEWVEA
jgi:uncharacterized protein DUF2817